MPDKDILATLLPIIVLLVLGIVTAIASRAVRMSPIVGYIVLGIGLKVTGALDSFGGPTLSLLANLGVVFLLFDIGLHFSIEHVKAQAKDIFAFGPVQVLFATASLGLVALLLGQTLPAALLIGGICALSSTAVVARLIAERHQQSCPVGLTATAILVFQDLAAIFLLIIGNSLQSAGNVLLVGALALLKSAVAFGVAVAAGRFVVGPVLRLVARTKNEEVFTAMALALALAAGWTTLSIGLSLTLGAFLGGLSLSETPYKAVIRSEIIAFRGLLLGFFFIFVGYTLDQNALIHQWPAIVVVTLLLIGVKIVANVAASRMFHWSVPGSTQLGFMLAQGSEFGFVILGLPAVRNLIGAGPASILVAATALSMAATPNLAGAGRNLAAYLRKHQSRPKSAEMEPKGDPGPVIIVGMGRIGRAVADALENFDIGYCGIERDHRRLDQAIADGYDAKFGDGTDIRLWQSVGLTTRKVTVLTAPDVSVQAEVSKLAAAEYPHLKRIIVAHDKKHAESLRALGLNTIEEDNLEFSENTVRAVLAVFSVAPADVEAWLRTRRDRIFPGPAAAAARAMTSIQQIALPA